MKQIDKIITKLQKTIQGTEFEGHVFVCGGYVRDLFLEKESKDIDLVVDIPNGGIKFAEWITKKYEVYKEGSNPVIFPNYGTANFRIDGKELEAVMTRREYYEEKNRKPITEFGTIEDDVLRRDFTINSLLYDISGEEVLDISGRGLLDLENKIIKTTGEPDFIFKQDPLRMLRAIRFSVKLNNEIDKSVLESIKKNKDMLQHISTERIRSEFNKILVHKNFEQGLLLLLETELMDYIIPELNETIGMTQNEYHTKDVFGHTLDVMSNLPNDNLILRLAGLLHDIGKIKTRSEESGNVHFYKHDKVGAEMAENILRRLKYDNATIKEVCSLINGHMRLKPFGHNNKISSKSLRKLSRVDYLDNLLILIDADNKAHKTDELHNQVDEIIKKLQVDLEEHETILVLPINGYDIMKYFGLKKPCKLVGVVLKQARDIVDDDPDIPKDELLNKLTTWVEKLPKENLKSLLNNH